MSGMAGKSGADQLNILNVKHTFEWCSFKLHYRLGYTIDNGVKGIGSASDFWFDFRYA